MRKYLVIIILLPLIIFSQKKIKYKNIEGIIFQKEFVNSFSGYPEYNFTPTIKDIVTFEQKIGNKFPSYIRQYIGYYHSKLKSRKTLGVLLINKNNLSKDIWEYPIIDYEIFNGIAIEYIFEDRKIKIISN